MVSDKDTYDFVCFTGLQLLTCGFHLEQRPENEMQLHLYGRQSGLVSCLSCWSPF